MIATMVTFAMPGTATPESIAAIQRERAGLYDATPGLISKTFWVDEVARTFGAFYLWEDKAPAEALFTEEWKARVLPAYEATSVEIHYLVATARAGS